MTEITIEHFTAHKNDGIITFTVTFDGEKKPVVATISRYECFGIDQLYISNCSDWLNSHFHDTLSSALREVSSYLSNTYGVKVKL